jgi:heme a synthase
MSNDSTIRAMDVTRNHQTLLFFAAGMTAILIAMGGIVCVTASGQGCPDWPGCFGAIVPPMKSDAIIEYLHRFVAILTSPLIVAAAIVGWRQTRSIHWVSRPPMIAIVFLIAVVIFGAFAVLTGLPAGVALLDIGSALIVLALMITATVMAVARRANPALPDQLAFRTFFARLTLWTVGAVFLVLVSAVLVSENGSLTRCLGWPLYNESMTLGDLRGWLQLARRVIAGVATIQILAIVIQAWRTQHHNNWIRRTATMVGVFFLLEITVGVMMLAGGFAIFLLVMYVAFATALWTSLIVLGVLTGLESVASDNVHLGTAPLSASTV